MYAFYPRVAQIEIDPQQIEAFEAAAREIADTSMREEPGVLGFFVVAERGCAHRFTILEIYQDEASYQRHRESPHFARYKRETSAWVKSLQLFDCVSIAVGVQPPTSTQTDCDHDKAGFLQK